MDGLWTLRVRAGPGRTCHAGGVTADLLRFDCPRCRREIAERLYGPCGRCRDELRTAFTSEERTVVAPAYEPKANVTPNAVATKD